MGYGLGRRGYGLWVREVGYGLWVREVGLLWLVIVEVVFQT